MKKTKFLFLLIIIVLWIPFLFSFQQKNQDNCLVNVPFHQLSFKSFTWNNWFNNVFQDDMEKAVKSNLGMGNNWVRLNNELNFRLFRYTNTSKLVLGKEDFFYEEIYISEYLGRNFIGDELLHKKIKALKRLQAVMKETYKIDLLLVLEPGKAFFSPEFIPNRYHPQEKTVSNYERVKYYCDAFDVTYLDLNQYFKDYKSKTPYLLYSKYGVHWSTYGLWVATDTLVDFIEQQCNMNLPDIINVGDSLSTQSRDLDFDLEAPMNLLCPLPHETMYFPVNQFDTSNTYDRPKVLTIADSYYWSFWESKIAANLFAENTFWYYNLTVYPHIWEPSEYVDDSKRKEQILNKDIVLLMTTDANLYDFGWQFVEQSLMLLDSSYVPDPEIIKLNEVMHNRSLYNDMLLESVRKQEPFTATLKRYIHVD